MAERSGAKVGAEALAVVLGLTSSRISQLKRDGILRASGRPLRYDLAESVQAYIAYAVDSARRRAPSDEDAERRKLRADADYKEAKARQEELRLAELEGRMHSAEDVERCVGELVYAVRSGVMALPGRIAVDVAGKTASEASAVVRRECEALLESLSGFRYDPARYEELVRSREGWRSDDEDE